VMNTHDFAPGANDDSSGTAVSLEAARVMSKFKFPATIVFVTVAGEEQGLNGSHHLAERARKEGWQLEGVLNNDIVGGDTTPGDKLQSKQRIRVFSQGILPSAPIEQIRQTLNIGAENETPSRQLAREVLAVGRTYFPGTFHPVMELRLDRFLRGGDHRSFSEAGFAAVRFTEWREDFNHQHKNIVRPPAGSTDPVQGDLPEFVDFKYVAQVTRLNAATLATLAFAPGEPQKVAIDAKDLGNGTTLTWDPPAGGGVGHYEVLWRETTSPNWQYAKDVPPAADNGHVSVSLPVSKDNVIFGIRAVDAKGHRGLVVAP